MDPFREGRAAAVDPLEFRRAVGHFATGVTVVTAYDGVAHQGMTANSFTSVSLEPVLVLVSVEKIARFHDTVLTAGTFVVNVLAADQEHVSRWFAARGLPHDPLAYDGARAHVSPVTGAAVFDDALATVECASWAVYDGGDHSLVVGEVLDLAVRRSDAAPLLYYAGRYRSL